jgi:hypothetical protein
MTVLMVLHQLIISFSFDLQTIPSPFKNGKEREPIPGKKRLRATKKSRPISFLVAKIHTAHL